MNFTITLNGEGPELANALQVLKSAIDGQSAGGSVSVNVAPQQQPQTLQQEPVYQQQAPVQQQTFPQLQPHFDQQAQQQQYDQSQSQGFPQQQPVYQQAQQQAPVQQQAQQYQPQQQPINGGGVPVATQAYTLDQLSVASTVLLDSGRQPELYALLGSYGIQALTQLNKELYGEFATRLRALGAKI